MLNELIQGFSVDILPTQRSVREMTRMFQSSTEDVKSNEENFLPNEEPFKKRRARYTRCPRKNVPSRVVCPSSKGTFFLGHPVAVTNILNYFVLKLNPSKASSVLKTCKI